MRRLLDRRMGPLGGALLYAAVVLAVYAPIALAQALWGAS